LPEEEIKDMKARGNESPGWQGLPLPPNRRYVPRRAS
jgi:hypothetical protein